MKKKNLKFKKYLKSKKGFSLLELVCAIMIMAIAVSATATGLNISNQSITKNSLMDKASAKAQMYCDVIMTYVEKTPSNDPYDGWDSLTEAQRMLINFLQIHLIKHILLQAIFKAILIQM